MSILKKIKDYIISEKQARAAIEQYFGGHISSYNRVKARLESTRDSILKDTASTSMYGPNYKREESIDYNDGTHYIYEMRSTTDNSGKKGNIYAKQYHINCGESTAREDDINYFALLQNGTVMEYSKTGMRRYILLMDKDGICQRHTFTPDKSIDIGNGINDDLINNMIANMNISMPTNSSMSTN